jgi:hypothetical protein
VNRCEVYGGLGASNTNDGSRVGVVGLLNNDGIMVIANKTRIGRS